MDPIQGPGFAALPERERLVRTAQELEAVVITQLMESMRGSVPESGLFEKSAADDIFRSMLDGELARTVAEKSPFGLADAIVARFQDQVQNDAPSAETKSDAGAWRTERSWRI